MLAVTLFLIDLIQKNIYKNNYNYNNHLTIWLLQVTQTSGAKNNCVLFLNLIFLKGDSKSTVFLLKSSGMKFIPGIL